MFSSVISAPNNVIGVPSNISLVPIGTAAATTAAAIGNSRLTESSSFATVSPTLRRRVTQPSPPPSSSQVLLAMPPKNPLGIDLASLRGSVAIQSTINLTEVSNAENPPSQSKWGVSNFACAEGAIVPCPADTGKEIDEILQELLSSNSCNSLVCTGVGACSVIYATASVGCEPGMSSAIISGLVESVKQIQQYFNLNVTYNTKAENLKTYNRLCTTLREKYCLLAMEFLDQHVAQKQLSNPEADQKLLSSTIAEAQTIVQNWTKITDKLREKLKLRKGDPLRKEITSDPTKSIAHPLKIAADIIICDGAGSVFDPKDSTTGKRLWDHFIDKLQKKQDRHEITLLRKTVEALTTPVVKAASAVVAIDISAIQKEMASLRSMVGSIKELVLVRRLDTAEVLKDIKIDIAALESKQRKLEKSLL